MPLECFYHLIPDNNLDETLEMSMIVRIGFAFHDAA